MAKVSLIQTNFSAGELSPRLMGRVDISRYQNGAKSLENALVAVQGGIMRTWGTEFVQPARYADKKVRLIPNAWRFYQNTQYRILHQSETDGTAYKTSRDTQYILRHHPLTQHLLPLQGSIGPWWVKDCLDNRNASLYAKGIFKCYLCTSG